MKTKKTKLLFIPMLSLALIGTLFISDILKTNLRIAEKQALEIASTAEAGLQTEIVKRLKAVPEDINKQEYNQIKNSLMRFVEINKDVRFAYIYVEKDEKIYFLVDSESVNSEDYSPPGQEYSEADDATFQALKQSEPIITKPAKDRWGNWVSILIPMKDFKTGNIIAVFGMDYPAKLWITNAIFRISIIVSFIICLLLLMISMYIILIKNMSLREEKLKLALANDKLGDKEEIFRTLFEQSPLGITFGNYNNRIVEANPMFEKIIGRSKEDVIKIGWEAITYPEDLLKNLDYYEKFMTGEIDGFSMIKRYVRPDGSIVWVNMKMAPIKIADKEYISHVCIIEDISERMQTRTDLEESERSYAMLLSNLPGMTYRCKYDRAWTMQFVSGGCYDLTGYRPESLLYNKELTFNDLITPYYRELLWDKWVQILYNKEIFKEEYSITTATGEVKWVYEQGQGVYDDKDEVVAIEGIIIDITDRKKREDEITYLHYHDVLTGLYNRIFFEKEKVRLDSEGQYPLSVIIGDINGLKLINNTIGYSGGDKLIVTIATILKTCCREADILARTGGNEFGILLPKTGAEAADKIIKKIGDACEQYKKDSKEEAYYISISTGVATKMNADELLSDIIKDADDSMYRHKLLQNRSLHSSIIASMKSTLYEKDQKTEEHAQRLIALSKTIGQSMNLTDKQLNELELLSTLHDIGKIGISDGILNKPGKLSDEEWVEMRKHPEIGYRIAMATPELSQIADYILSHHERWDGTGYPQGLKGKEIPLLSRILAVADSYDAMTTDRPYRKALTEETAIGEIKKCSGTQFDPEIADLFLKNLPNIILDKG